MTQEVNKEVEGQISQQVGYQEKSYPTSAENEQIRHEAFQQKECQRIFNKLISHAGGFDVVRKGRRTIAKKIATTCFLNSTEPDYEGFKQGVLIANEQIILKRN
ncbi:hypothetical protein FQ087_01950 [Sporosarcina sp. ANT_H38]|uniref:hypothetical protein n=1 Tax=Sporosarcina sp. ANT_H38 TaxID=2597358 RepID=UPI0011F17E23|nr:hypothetical protein [Sporosarcina sp. ANT_H38]KAA0965102.1 hypothetical protein FQ087_01950 [Sporosarcina sp. ANT_H38]